MNTMKTLQTTQRLYRTILLGTGSFLGFILNTTKASAQSDDYGLSQTASQAGLQQRSVEQYTGDIIGAFLVLSGSIFLALIVYGGILYMISQGEDTKVKKAKSIIVYAVLGVIILAASYAILTFVFEIFA